MQPLKPADSRSDLATLVRVAAERGAGSIASRMETVASSGGGGPRDPNGGAWSTSLGPAARAAAAVRHRGCSRDGLRLLRIGLRVGCFDVLDSKIFRAGGPVMWPLLLCARSSRWRLSSSDWCSVCASPRVCSTPAVVERISGLTEGGSPERAISACREQPGNLHQHRAGRPGCRRTRGRGNRSASKEAIEDAGPPRNSAGSIAISARWPRSSVSHRCSGCSAR